MGEKNNGNSLSEGKTRGDRIQNMKYNREVWLKNKKRTDINRKRNKYKFSTSKEIYNILHKERYANFTTYFTSE